MRSARKAKVVFQGFGFPKDPPACIHQPALHSSSTEEVYKYHINQLISNGAITCINSKSQRSRLVVIVVTVSPARDSHVRNQQSVLLNDTKSIFTTAVVRNNSTHQSKVKPTSGGARENKTCDCKQILKLHSSIEACVVLPSLSSYSSSTTDTHLITSLSILALDTIHHVIPKYHNNDQTASLQNCHVGRFRCRQDVSRGPTYQS